MPVVRATAFLLLFPTMCKIECPAHAASEGIRHCLPAVDARFHRTVRRYICIVVVSALAGCSPYLYKTEIDGFAKGVDDLGTAYESGRQLTATDRVDNQHRDWQEGRAKLALSVGCSPPPSGPSDAGDICSLREIGKSTPGPGPSEQESAKAAPIVKALRKYAQALAAVSNVADRDALIAAQAQLKGSVQALAKAADTGQAGAVGPIADLFSTLMLAALDQRRFDILKAGVNAANPSISVLGPALGNALEALRLVRIKELRIAADFHVASLGPTVSRAEYSTHLNKAWDMVNAIDRLRTASPQQAALDMVKAHAELATAINDDSRQFDAVAATIGDFIDKANAVKSALGN
jgi:hypothetical protein